MGPVDATGRSIAVLYVDDTPMLVDMVSRMLDALDYEPHGFVDAREALAAVEADEPGFSLIMVDRSMPVMSGLDLAKRIRETRPDLPIILVTGMLDPSLEASYAKLGFASVMTKPFTSADLATHVARALNESDTPPSC